MKKGYRSIKYKIMAMFISVAVFQIGMIAIFAVYHLKPNITDIYREHQKTMSEAMLGQLSDVRDDIEDYSVNIAGDPELQHFLENANQQGMNGKYLIFTMELRNKILSYTNYDNRIKAIYLIDNRGQIFSNAVDASMKKFLEEAEFLLIPKASRPLWINGKNDCDVVMCRVINNNTTDLNRKIGILCIVLDKKKIVESVDWFMTESAEHYMLKSQDGHFLLGDSEEVSNLTAQKDSFLYYLCEDNVWGLLTWIDKETVYSQVYAIFRLIFTEMIVLLAVSVCLIVFLSGRLTKPLHAIRSAMKQVEIGNMDIKVPVMNNDEIGELASNMNKMSGKIKELVEHIKEEDTKLRSLELSSMQYQINPHFLYNTLDSIHMYARKNNAVEISEMVMALSNFFRMSLSHGNEFIKIKEEIQYAVYYMDIQKIRFPNQLEWVITIDETVQETYMLKFILQPLVENSINHGIRNREGKGCIWITAAKRMNRIIIEVRDDGMGMLPQELEQLIETLEEENKEQDPYKGGFGMRNVHQRLKLYYGKDSGLSIESNWEEGTVISFQIPQIETFPG